MSGWIKLHRDITNHWIWKSQNRLYWWLDILLMVNHADSKVLIRGQLIECKRGQSVMSLGTWAKRWNVTKKTVKDFFELLQKDSMLVYDNIKITTRITVCNYDIYQGEVNRQDIDGKQLVNGQGTVTIPKQERIRRKKNGDENYTDKSISFYTSEVEKAKGYSGQVFLDYITLCRHICNKKDGEWVLPYVLKIKTQISLDDFIKLYNKSGKNIEKITTKIDTIQSTINYHDKYDNLYFTINNWFNRDNK